MPFVAPICSDHMFCLPAAHFTLAETLYLYRNTLTGPIPESFGELDLKEFQVYENRLTGEIPEEFYNNENLQLLRIDFNSITGTLSESLGDMGGLQDLRVNENLFSGPLPESLSDLNNLGKCVCNARPILCNNFGSSFVVLSNHACHGSFFVCVRAVVFRVNDNSFSERIPDGFNSWGSLDFADFSSNDFSGPIPSTIFGIESLRILYLSNNNLSGKLPDNFGDSPVLRDLFINGNALTGEVPDINSGQLAKLTEFLLQENQFSGSMPSSICELRDSGILDDLWADCDNDAEHKLECQAPQCCTLCFPP